MCQKPISFDVPPKIKQEKKEVYQPMLQRAMLKGLAKFPLVVQIVMVSENQLTNISRDRGGTLKSTEPWDTDEPGHLKYWHSYCYC